MIPRVITLPHCQLLCSTVADDLGDDSALTTYLAPITYAQGFRRRTVRARLARRVQRGTHTLRTSDVLHTYIRYKFYATAYPACRLLNSRLSKPHKHVCLVGRILRNGRIALGARRRLSHYLAYHGYRAAYPSNIHCRGLLSVKHSVIRRGIGHPLPRQVLHRKLHRMIPHPTIFHTLALMKLILQPFLPRRIETGLPTRAIGTGPHPPLHRGHQILVLRNYTRPALSPGAGTTATQILSHLKVDIVSTGRTNYYNTISCRLGTRRGKLTQTHGGVST